METNPNDIPIWDVEWYVIVYHIQTRLNPLLPKDKYIMELGHQASNPQEPFSRNHKWELAPWWLMLVHYASHESQNDVTPYNSAQI